MGRLPINASVIGSRSGAKAHADANTDSNRNALTQASCAQASCARAVALPDTRPYVHGSASRAGHCQGLVNAEHVLFADVQPRDALAVQAGRRLAQHHGHASLRGWRCASRWEMCQPRQHSRSTVRGLNVWRDVRSHSSSPRPARGWCEQSGSFCCAQHGHSSSAVRCLIGCPCFPQVVKAEMRSAAQHLDVGLPAQLTRRTLAMTDAGSGTSGAQHCRRCSALA